MIKLDVTLRRAEELNAQEQEIQRLNDVILSKEREIRKMSEFAALYIGAIDQLKEAQRVLNDAGLDSSFIQLRKM